MRGEHGLLRSAWKPGGRLGEALRGALDLALPPHGLDGQASPHGIGLSSEAWNRIVFLEEPVCDGCGAPFEHGLGAGALCAACEARPRRFARARAACLYDEGSRDLILQLKHADRLDLAPLFARWLNRAARTLLAEADAIAPVPMHPWRLLSRRYNQAAEIARPLSRLSGVDYWPDVVRRVRRTESQGGKSGSGRRRNVAGAFAVPPRLVPKVADKRVLLVDDVLTTGATAEGCARALLKAGASAVDLAVVARVKEASHLTI
ncbi:MAG: ComF family protein [Caulobacteraceae bacterium]|nr:ComF family protein [Caulobacteraceae bacterium]